MKWLNHIPSWIRNKYFLAITFFVAWMLFFDAKDLTTDFQRRAKLRELQKNERHLALQIRETRNELNLLKTNAQTIEKYAREKYMMKKDNEDLFIIRTTSAPQ